MSNEFEIQAFFTKYNFLQKYNEGVTDVEVAEFDDGFMHFMPWSRTARGSVVSIKNIQELKLLDKNGAPLATVRSGIDAIRHGVGSSNEHTEGQTIAEACLLLGKVDQIEYAVLVHKGFIIRDHNSQGGNLVALYIKGEFDIQEFLDEMATDELSKLG